MAAGTGSEGSKESVEEAKEETNEPLVNDFRLAPVRPFQKTVVQKILQEKTDQLVSGLSGGYDFDELAVACRFLSLDLLAALNELEWPSFKILVLVKCVETIGQTGRGGIRYYWNPVDDGLVTVQHKTKDAFIFVTGGFFYYE